MKKFMSHFCKCLIILLLLFANHSHARLKRTRIDIVENRHFYIGAGCGYSFYNLNNEFEYTVEFTNNGKIERHAVEIFGPLIGIKFQDRYGFGAELGYNFLEPLNITGIKEGKLTIRNTFLDFINYIPIATEFDNIKVELLAGFGIGHMSMREYGGVGAIGSNDCYKKYGLRGKIGLQYNVDLNWSVRGLLVYQKVGPRSGLYGINSAKSLGLDVLRAF